MRKKTICSALFIALAVQFNAAGGLLGTVAFSGEETQQGSLKVSNSDRLRSDGEGVVFGKSGPAPHVLFGQDISREGTLVFSIRPKNWESSEEDFDLFSGRSGENRWFLGKAFQRIMPRGAVRVRPSALTLVCLNPDTTGKYNRPRYHGFNFDGVGDWPDGEWRHIAIVWRKGQFVQLFVDGQFAGGIEMDIPWPTESFTELEFGGKGDRSPKVADTGFRDLQVYSRALSRNEIHALFARSEAGSALPAVAAAEGRDETVLFPVARADAPPVLDGRIGDGEYPVRISGLIETVSGAMWKDGSGLAAADDGTHVTIAGWLAVRSSRDPRSARSAPDADPTRNSNIDLFVIQLQNKQAQTDNHIEGPYLLIQPDGTVYSAWSDVTWYGGTAKRTLKEFGTEVASRVEDGIWTVEVRIPRERFAFDGPGSIFSAGFRYYGAQIGYRIFPRWFDHPTAFSRMVPTEIGMTLDFSALTQGSVTPEIVLENRSAEAASGSVEVVIGESRIVQSQRDFNFDELIGEKLDIQTGSVFKGWREPFAVGAGQAQKVAIRDALSAPDLYLLKTRVVSGDRDLYFRPLPFVYYSPLSVENRIFPSSETVVSAVALNAVDAGPGDHLALDVQDEQGLTKYQRTVPATGDGQVVEWSMENLEPGKHTLIWRLGSLKDGTMKEPKASLYQTFEKREPFPWQTEKVAAEALGPDWCPQPWTPVTVEGRQIDIWGRTITYRQESLLPAITSRSKSVISQPALVEYERGGQWNPIPLDTVDVQRQGDGRAEAKLKGATADFSLVSKQTIEFDGFIWIELEINPVAAAADVDGMRLEIPMDGMLYYREWSTYSRKGRIADWPYYHRTHCMLFSSEDTGLSWSTENYSGWKIDTTRPRMELKKGGEGRPDRLILNLVNTPVRIDEPMVIRFGLHPTPVRPLISRHRDWRFHTSAGSNWQKSAQTLGYLHGQLWGLGFGQLEPANWQLLADASQAHRDAGLKFYPYVLQFHQSFYERLKRSAVWTKDNVQFRASNAHPNIDQCPKIEATAYFYEEWKNEPLIVRQAGTPTAFMAVNMASSFIDYQVWNLRELLTRSEIDGLYTDSAIPQEDANPALGRRVVTLDGQVEPTIPLLGARELEKRFYWVYETFRGQERVPYVTCHGRPEHTMLNSFRDLIIEGEWFKPAEKDVVARTLLRENIVMPNYATVQGSDPEAPWSYDAAVLRGALPQQATGVPLCLLPQHAKGAAPPEVRKEMERDPEISRQMMAFMFPCDMTIWPSRLHSPTIFDFWDRVQVPFGMSDTEFFGYWENGVQTSDPAFKVSYYKKNGAEDYLVLVANWSEKPLRASVTLPEALRGLGTAEDMEKPGVTLPVSPELRIEIPAYDLRALRVSRR